MCVHSAVADYWCDDDDDDDEMLFESWETVIAFDNLKLTAGFIACKYSSGWIHIAAIIPSSCADPVYESQSRDIIPRM